MVFKRHTRRSTEFGGVPGAAPVLIGWAAVTGSLDWPAVVVFGVVFCWQMPHFWALAMRFKDDYARADVPMLPVVTTALSVGRQTVAWAWVTVAVSLLLWPVGADYGIGLGLHGRGRGALGAWFIVEAHRLLRRIKQRRRDQADAAVPRLDLVPGAAVGRDRRRRHRLRCAATSPTRGWVSWSVRTAAPTRSGPRGSTRAEVEALIESGCPVVTYFPGGRLVWHDEDDAWPAWADARSASETVTAGRWEAVDGGAGGRPRLPRLPSGARGWRRRSERAPEGSAQASAHAAQFSAADGRVAVSSGGLTVSAARTPGRGPTRPGAR